MSLTIWDLITDDFSYTDLENNWIEVDQHDHSPGNGVPIGTAGIANDAITQTQLAPNSVGTGQLQDASVTGSKIAPGSITGSDIAAGTVTGINIANGTITITNLDPTLIPLGQVSLFWRPAGSGAVPGGFWELMDGRAWSGITNAWNLTSGNIPDTRNQYLKGGDIFGSAGPAPGATGGSATANLAHSHNVSAHAHGIPAHTHSISSDGAHIHTFANGFFPWLRSDSFSPWPFNITVQDFGGTQRQNTYNSMYLKGYDIAVGGTGGGGGGSGPAGEFLGDVGVGMDSSGVHSHGGGTGATGFGSNLATAVTDTQLGSIAIAPPFIGFCLMMRVR
jgi:hypothetical protein